MNPQEQLRKIPQVDLLLRTAALEQAAKEYGRDGVRTAVAHRLEALRQQIMQGQGAEMPSQGDLIASVLEQLAKSNQPRLRRVINATGVVLHTNLGRAPLADAALDAVYTVAGGYSNLEYDLQTGSRGSRNAHLEDLLCTLCGCEAALVVNNNAAAVLLAMSALARGKEIVVSRGELVEIGDSFRIPELIEQSGGHLREVGTTNKTHLSDYAHAVEQGNVGVLLKVHTSNYRIIGFTQSVEVDQLVTLGHQHQIPVVVDLGSGALLEEGAYPFTGEPTVPQLLRQGADLVCFSGDKLLGGPQAGILVGSSGLIDRLRRHPLARALRIDKLSLAALEATLRLYTHPEKAKESIPVLRMLCTPPQILRQRAEQLQRLLAGMERYAKVELVETTRPVGGGSVPEQSLPSYGVAVKPYHMTVDALETRLRQATTPILARIAQDRLILDAATLQDNDLPLVAEQMEVCLCSH